MENVSYNQNPTKETTLVIYGDSISTGSHGEGGYEAAVAGALGIARVHNHAIGSSGLCLATPNALVSLLEKKECQHPEADVILLWHGSNDWYWGAELGSLDEESPATFAGAIALAVRRLRSLCPHAAIVWPTPIWRLERPDGVESPLQEAWCMPNKSGVTQREIAACIWQASHRLCFSAPDMRRQCGIHEGTAALLLEDGVHPNRAGYRGIARVLIEAIGKTMPL